MFVLWNDPPNVNALFNANNYEATICRRRACVPIVGTGHWKSITTEMAVTKVAPVARKVFCDIYRSRFIESGRVSYERLCHSTIYKVVDDDIFLTVRKLSFPLLETKKNQRYGFANIPKIAASFHFLFFPIR